MRPYEAFNYVLYALFYKLDFLETFLLLHKRPSSRQLREAEVQEKQCVRIFWVRRAADATGVALLARRQKSFSENWNRPYFGPTDRPMKCAVRKRNKPAERPKHLRTRGKEKKQPNLSRGRSLNVSIDPLLDTDFGGLALLAK